MKVLCLIIATFLSYSAFAEGAVRPSIEFAPSNFIVDISKNENIKINVTINAKRPDILIGGVKQVEYKVLRTGDQVLVERGTLKSLEALKEYVFTPDRPGGYRIFLKAEMKSGFIFDENILIKAVDIPGVETLATIILHSTDPFDLEIPLPDILYKALDLVFVIDNSGSMANEIKATKAASKEIFVKLKNLTGDVKASVVTFSKYHLNKGSNVYGSGNYNLIIPPTSNPDDFENMPVQTSGGDEFQFFALYKTSKNKELWREGSVKLLVLMTDEADNVYCSRGKKCSSCNFGKQVNWSGEGKKSVKELNKYLSENDYSATVLYNEIDGAECYGNIMKEYLRDKFAGIYKIPDSPNAAGEIVKNLYASLNELVKSAVISLEPMDDEKKLVAKIEPLKPQQCIDERHTGFKYKCAQEKGRVVKFKVTFNKRRLNIKRYNFLLIVKTDKGSLVAVKPVSITF